MGLLSRARLAEVLLKMAAGSVPTPEESVAMAAGDMPGPQIIDQHPHGLEGRLKRPALPVARNKKLEGPRAYAPRI